MRTGRGSLQSWVERRGGTRLKEVNGTEVINKTLKF